MNDPTTVAELIKWVEENFVCGVGPPSAFIEIPVGPNGACQRYIYLTHAVMGESEVKLVKALQADFAMAIASVGEGALLFWRLSYKIDLTPHNFGMPCLQLRTRFVIPALTWSDRQPVFFTAKAEGAEMVRA